MGMKWVTLVIFTTAGFMGWTAYWITTQQNQPTASPTVDNGQVTTLIQDTSELRVSIATMEEQVRQLTVLKQAALQRSIDACDLVALEVKETCLKLKQRPGWEYK